MLSFIYSEIRYLLKKFLFFKKIQRIVWLDDFKIQQTKNYFEYHS